MSTAINAAADVSARMREMMDARAAAKSTAECMDWAIRSMDAYTAIWASTNAAADDTPDHMNDESWALRDAARAALNAAIALAADSAQDALQSAAHAYALCAADGCPKSSFANECRARMDAAAIALHAADSAYRQLQ